LLHLETMAKYLPEMKKLMEKRLSCKCLSRVRRQSNT
jgi:hypothetical protein